MSFPKQVFVTMAAISAAGAWPLAAWGTPEVVTAAAAGGAMATANVLAGYAAIRRSVGKPMTTFLKYILGGMGIRLLALTGLLLLLTKVAGLPPVALVASLGVFYAAYLALEVIYIQQQLSIRQSS